MSALNVIRIKNIKNIRDALFDKPYNYIMHQHVYNYYIGIDVITILAYTSSVEDTDDDTNFVHSFVKNFSPVVPPGM